VRIEHDKTTDSAYLGLLDTEISRSESLLPWLVVDFDAADRIVGLEVLDASRHLDLARSGPVVELAGTREAAEVFGVRPSNFIRDLAGRSDFPKPLAELASTRVWDRSELVAYRNAHRGRG
jgi:uncharacterized protein YuzE